HALLVTGCAPDDLGRLLDTLHASRVQPVCLDVLNRAAVATLTPPAGRVFSLAGWAVVIGLEGNRETVAWQVRQLGQEIAANNSHGVERPTGPALVELWRTLVEFPLWPEARLTWKANLLPSATAEFCRTAETLSER